jgi:hypothetical protein
MDYRPLTGSRPKWVGAVVLRIQRLLHEGFLAGVPPTNVQKLVVLLADPTFHGAPMPFVSPAAVGGISAEFRAGGVELHIGFDDDGEATVYAFHAPDFEWEGPLAIVPDGIDKWAWRLAHEVH